MNCYVFMFCIQLKRIRMNLRLLLIVFCCLVVHSTNGTATGDRVAEWSPESGVNPEELGDDIVRGNIVRETGFPAVTPWPAGIIPYEITGQFDTTETQTIMDAIDDINRLTCVRFVPRTNELIYVRISSHHNGCFSSIGYHTESYDINLQTPACLYYKGTVLHELLHAVGSNHEQNLPGRDNFVNVHWENIDEDDETKFSILPSSGYERNYNFGSVMHFSNKAFSKNKKRTLTGKSKGFENFVMGQRQRLTGEDIDRVNRRYGCYLESNAAVVNTQNNMVTNGINRNSENRITFDVTREAPNARPRTTTYNIPYPIDWSSVPANSYGSQYHRPNTRRSEYYNSNWY